MAATDECEYEYDALMGIIKGEAAQMIISRAEANSTVCTRTWQTMPQL